MDNVRRDRGDALSQDIRNDGTEPIYGGVIVEGDILGAADIPDGASVLHVVVGRLRRLLDREQTATLAAAGGVTIAEWRSLFMLATDGSMTQGDLVRKTAIEQSQASRVIRAMELSQMIETARDPNDRRRWLCSLTPKGNELFQRLDPVMRRRRASIDSWPRRVKRASSCNETQATGQSRDALPLPRSGRLRSDG